MDPFTIVGLLMLAASTALQYSGAKRAEKQRESAVAAEAERQSRLGREAQAQLNLVTPAFTRESQEATRGALEEQQKEGFKQPSVEDIKSASYATTATGAPTEVQSNLARVLTDALKKGRSYADTQARLSSYGGLNLGNSILLGRSGEALNQIGQFGQASSSILPMELQAANQAGAGRAGWADVMAGGGQLASLYGLTRAKTPQRWDYAG